MSVVCRVETSICKRVMTPSLTQKHCFCLPRSHSTVAHNKISCCIKQLPPTCGHKLATEPSNEIRRVRLCCPKSSIVFPIRNKPEHCSQDSKLTVSMPVCAVIFPAWRVTFKRSPSIQTQRTVISICNRQWLRLNRQAPRWKTLCGGLHNALAGMSSCPIRYLGRAC